MTKEELITGEEIICSESYIRDINPYMTVPLSDIIKGNRFTIYLIVPNMVYVKMNDDERVMAIENRDLVYYSSKIGRVKRLCKEHIG